MSFLKNIFGPKCPYCSGELEKKPGRKKKCPHCGEYIYIRDGEMKTETGKDFIDYAKRLYWLEVTVSKLEKEQRKLSKKFGAEASANDTIWSILNRSLEAGNYDRNSRVYMEMARVLEVEGKDFTHLIEESQKQTLMGIKQRASDIPGHEEKIVIDSYVNDGYVCEKCQELDGREFSMDEPIENIPLPAEVCESETGCRCTFRREGTSFLDEDERGEYLPRK